jgi:hypothetical protein
MEATDDWELLSVVQPFFCWRAIVIASPVWIPNLDVEVSKKLLNFAENILNTEEFDPGEAGDLLEASS